ncbi:MAG: HD family phosphohydrolase [Syntrophomonadaceae bacterium]|jgi:putative nucleotidyltransferase with HDIG domain|nr:HDIG domain-containing protein [Bacillota bacterium]NLP23509.1 HDIG domain-containing protein [Syntrophomonadaceae bacterium]
MRVPSFLIWIGNTVASFFRNSTTQKVLGVMLFFSVTILIVFSSFSPKQVMLKPDEVAQADIQSKINAVVIDERQTDELRKQAADKVQKVYQEDKYALVNTNDDINRFFNSVTGILSTADEDHLPPLHDLIESTNTLRDEANLQLHSPTLAQYIVNAQPEDLELIRQAALSVVQNLLNKPVTDEALPDIYQQAQTQIDSMGYSRTARDIIKLVAINSLRPNLIYNAEATAEAIQEASNAIQPVQKNIKAGEIIVRAGDRVTVEQISILEQLGIQRTQSYTSTLIGAGLFVLLTFWVLIQFLRRYYSDIFKDDRLMLLIGLVFIIILLLTRFLTMIKISDNAEINSLVGYLAPVAAGSMLIAILLDNRLAHFLTLVMALYVGLITEGNQLFYGITAFVGGTVGVFQVYRLSQISDLAKSALYVALANIVTIVTLSMIGGSLSWNLILVGILIGAINGILSAILMIGALPYLESAFSITSMIKLLELSNPNHFLLKRLLLEAPGTYHHSLMVGNLAEASAESIGANPLLVRVGAYYHDIGKLKRPEYFVENQRGFENPHEKIAPALSALIITSHVKDGLEYARDAHLPEVVNDFIAQHHGNSLTRYFYGRALEEDRDGTISEDSFRYEGPKPQSKEVALVMLADSVEAAIRSLQEPTDAKIREMVKKIIKDKLNDGQLESCDLTFKDLDTITQSFCTILEGMYHKRIEYPEVIVKEFERRRETHGDNDHQSTERD